MITSQIWQNMLTLFDLIVDLKTFDQEQLCQQLIKAGCGLVIYPKISIEDFLQDLVKEKILQKSGESYTFCSH